MFVHYVWFSTRFFTYISKNILYDSNKVFFSWLYHIHTTYFQGRQWVVGSSYYYIMGNNLSHNFQKTILMLGITSFVVKIVKQKTNVSHIFLQCSNALAFFVFIELCNSSLGDDFTPLPSSTKSPKKILQSATPLSPQPSNPIGNI